MTQFTQVLRCGVALLGLLVVCSADGPDGRILGGEEATATATPYAASLRVDNAHVCGASIVGSLYLVTAAHCCHRDGKLIAASRMSARVGSTNQYAGGRVVSIASIIPHPEYYKLQNNVAVIKLTSPLVWDNRVQPINMATESERDLPTDGDAIMVTGWGTTVEGTTSFKIRQLALTLASNDVCSDAYSAHDGQTFCLSHGLKEGTCHGDGGSGAVYDNKLVGITHFVVGACGSRYPDVFIRFSRFAKWVQEQMV